MPDCRPAARGILRDLEMLEDVTVSLITERRVSRCWGPAGGGGGHSFARGTSVAELLRPAPVQGVGQGVGQASASGTCHAVLVTKLHHHARLVLRPSPCHVYVDQLGAGLLIDDNDARSTVSPAPRGRGDGAAQG